MTYNPNITDFDKRTVVTKLALYNSETSRIDIELLSQELRMSRRKLRDIVEAVNCDESPEFADKMVLTDTSEGGYWLAVRGGNPAPAHRNIASEYSRGNHILTKARAMERKVTRIYGSGQEAMF